MNSTAIEKIIEHEITKGHPKKTDTPKAENPEKPAKTPKEGK
jgi:hypothetical protein